MRCPVLLLTWTLTTAVCTTSCAHIDAFRADPRSACVDDPVTVTWAASGRVRLVSTPDLPGTGAQPDEGTKIFTVAQDTMFELRADGLLRDDHAEAEVVVAPPSKGYGDVAECHEDTGILETEFMLKGQISSAFRADRVTEVLGRRLSITKDGRQATLGPGQSSEALRGLPIVGSWHLESPLDPGENCEQALRSIRQRLRFQVDLVCGGGDAGPR